MGVNMIIEHGLALLEETEEEEELKGDLDEAICHGILVSNLAYLLSKELGLSDAYCYDMAKAGIVHDIGKLKLGQYLYGRKKDTLKIEEMKYVRLHPKLGLDVLRKSGEYSEVILESIFHHHENYDGSGYPDNLIGRAIPYGARILRTCDVFAALVSERPYRAAFDVEVAIELMIDEVKNFDMHIFLNFMKIVHSEEFVQVKNYVEEINRNKRKRLAV